MANLYEPLKLRGKAAPSRALFGAHCTNFATDNLPNQRHVAYYERRAAGGAGLVVVEESSVHHSDWPYEKALRGYMPEIVERFRQIAGAVQAQGSLVLAQLGHNGMQASGHVHKHVVYAPSAIPNPATMEMPKVMEKADIAAVVAGFGLVARHARQGGLDGVEINAGQYSLVRQFLSGLTNQRQDEYGGTLPNRLRFAREVIKVVREALGPELVLGLRLSCDEYAPWAGLKPEDGLEVAVELCQSGEVDYLVVTTGSIYTMHLTAPAMHTPAGQRVDLASQVKQRLGDTLAVFLCDDLVDPVAANTLVVEGKLDGIDLTRALIADPDLVNKLRSGQPEEVRPCIRCNQDCVVRSPMNAVVSCIHNPAAGYEKSFPALQPANRPRKVLVVGAGAGGLEAAMVCRLRGHQVVVYEKSAVAGGAVRLSTLAPNRAEFSRIIEWRLAQLARLGVPVELSVTVTPELIEQLQPEVVIVATGARVRPDETPGADLPHVVSVTQLLAGQSDGSGTAVVIDSEGYQSAINAAEYLAAQGRPVEFITEDNFVSLQLGALQELTPWYSRAAATGITFSPMTSVLRIEKDRVNVRHRFAPADQERIIKNVDTVVMANYALPEDSLYQALQGADREIYRLGDAVAPRRVTHAIIEAQRLGRQI